MIVITDTETTGTDPQVDRLVELAGVELSDKRPEFTTLVDPQRDIPPEAMAIHHITREETLDQPVEHGALLKMFTHFEDEIQVFAAHNAKVDRAFLERILNGRLGAHWICTYKCALVVWPDAPGHSNQVLRYWLKLKVDVPPGLFPHRALYDCYVTREILRELLKHKSVAELIQISSGPVLLTKVTFGKHKGKLWSEVDYGYLKWCVGPQGLVDNEDALFTAQHYIKRYYK